jgi:LysM repeat protein
LLAGVLALLLMAGAIVGAGSAFADSQYTIQPGDTLTSIAARYGTTVDALVAANNLPNRSMIYAGQTLTIPSSSSSSGGNSGGSGNAGNPGSTQQPQQPANPSGTYVVQYGDNLSAIAYRYGTTVAALMQANGLTNTTIYAGQVLKIAPANYSPVAQPSPTQQPQQPANPPGTYVVQPGDSFSRIAAKYGISAQALAQANGLTIGSYIYTGQILVIPNASAPKATAAPPTIPPTPAGSTPVPVSSVPASMPTAANTTTPMPVQSPSQAPLGRPVKYTVVAGDNLSSIAARFGTTVDSLMQLNGLTDPNFVYVGEVLTIVKGDDQSNTTPVPTGTPQPGAPIPTPTPPMGKFGPKWVDVNLSTQTMVAYEGETPVYSSRVSSGVPDHPTVVGTYRVYAKYVSTRMKGGTPGIDYYDIPNVPYTMYFYSDYALHGAYWHNNFGHPMSHGCVNLPVDVSKWMYDWAPIGTMVVTHY